MDEDAVSDDKTDPSIHDVEEDNVSLQEADSSDGEILRELRGAGEVLTRVELDLAYSSEKLLNLDIFMMHVVDRENDYETSAMENEEISDDSVQKALEFNFLSGILDSEVRELEKLMASLQPEIVDVREKISSCGHFRETFNELERKLHDSEESLEQSQNQVAEIRMQCDKFQRTLLAICGQDNWNDSKDGDFSDNDHFSNRNAKIKMQTAEQQRHILRMLEKSLARELDLEKKLSDSRHGEEELNQKLHSAEQEMFCMDEAVEDVVWRLFKAENAAEVLMGISKEMMGRLQIVQFNLNSSILREGEIRSKLQDLMKPTEMNGNGLRMLETGCETPDDLVETKLDATNLQEDGKDTHNSSEVITLREKVQSLELQLKECESQLQSTKDSVVENQKQQTVLTSRLSEMNNIIEDLNENMSKAESRAETAETKFSLLAESNLVLTEELSLIKSSDNGMEKVNSLEKQLRESDNQLQHAKASVEASQEQQNMLYSAIADMENLINDLKSKVLKAESRAEKSDTKCAILSETNLELNEE
ncbi:Wpp domain-interacting tail-anchored protein 1-like, partial [Thalictrum thalictroides]